MKGKHFFYTAPTGLKAMSFGFSAIKNEKECLLLNQETLYRTIFCYTYTMERNQ